MLPYMSDQGSDDEQVAQRFDRTLLRLLKTPPQSRAELAEEVRRANEGKPTRGRPRSQGRKLKAGRKSAERGANRVRRP